MDVNKVGDKNSMSEYLRQQGALKERQKYVPNSTISYRQKQIAIIQDMLSGYGATHSKARWKSKDSQLTDDEWYRMYVSFEYMSKVINELKILAPYMSNFNTDEIKKIKILKKTLTKDHLDWGQLLYEIYETLETKGDFYAYWNTSEQSKVDGIPVLRVLESENMQDVELDPYTNEPVSYVYKETVSDRKLNEDTGEYINQNERVVTWIFKKGYIRINDPIKYPVEGHKVFYNGIEYSDTIRIIHIPSFKKQHQSFSDIPAIQYIDPCLLLNKIDTNRDIINDHLGFPFPFIIGGKIDAENSALIPGGAGYITPDEWAIAMDKMPEIVKMEINNTLQSIIDEKADAVSDLYKKVSLIRETLEETLSGSDSSRNISQLRLGIEQKNRKYYENIAEGLAPYFRVVLKENSALSDKDFKSKKSITFELPDVLINNSIFDSLMITQIKRGLGFTTLEKDLKAEGYTQLEIDKRKQEVQEEQYSKENDMSFNIPNEATEQVMNGSGVTDLEGIDNRLK